MNALTEHRGVIKFLTRERKEFEKLRQNSHPNTGHGSLERESRGIILLSMWAGGQSHAPGFGQRGK